MTKIPLMPIAHTNKQTSYLFAGFGAGVISAWAICAWFDLVPSDSSWLPVWMSGVVGVGAMGLVAAGFLMDARFERVEPKHH